MLQLRLKARKSLGWKTYRIILLCWSFKVIHAPFSIVVHGDGVKSSIEQLNSNCPSFRWINNIWANFYWNILHHRRPTNVCLSMDCVCHCYRNGKTKYLHLTHETINLVYFLHTIGDKFCELFTRTKSCMQKATLWQNFLGTFLKFL